MRAAAAKVGWTPEDEVLLKTAVKPRYPVMLSSAPPRYLLPPEVIQVDSASSDWKEFFSSDGHLYYVNSKTKISSWEKPLELMDPIERVDASIGWKEFCTEYGDRYYYNKMTKKSVWCIPNELKVARELIRKASKFYQICREKDLLDICSEDPKLGDESDEFEETKFLCDWLQHHLSDKVDKVQMSKLVMSPFALKSPKLGSAPELQRMLGSTRGLRRERLSLIINPDHPVTKELNAVLKIKHDIDNTEDKAVADFLYEVALISSGYAPTTPAELYNTIYLVLEIVLAGRWGRSNDEASAVSKSSSALAIETLGLRGNAMELLSLVLLGFLKFKLHN